MSHVAALTLFQLNRGNLEDSIEACRNDGLKESCGLSGIGMASPPMAA